MMRRFAGYDRTALIAGIFFIAMGILFLLDQLDVIRLRAAYFIPIVLIILGAAILIGARRPARR
jgi:hypothetical protein